MTMYVEVGRYALNAKVIVNVIIVLALCQKEYAFPEHRRASIPRAQLPNISGHHLNCLSDLTC